MEKPDLKRVATNESTKLFGHKMRNNIYDLKTELRKILKNWTPCGCVHKIIDIRATSLLYMITPGRKRHVIYFYKA